MATVVKDLGAVTAYAYAVAGGYSGTEAEFEALLGNIAEDLSEIENLSVTVTTLPAGSSATASYNNGVLSLGIPKGDKGDKGDTGATGATGATGPQGIPGDVANLASAYSASSTYGVGDYCIYNGSLYRCTTPITTAEAWTAAHWTAVKLADDVAEVVGTVNGMLDVVTGQNMCDMSNPTTGFVISNGTISTEGGYSGYKTSGYIPVEASAKYCFTTWHPTQYYKTTQRKAINQYDSDKNLVSYNYTNQSGQESVVVTMSATTAYIRISSVQNDLFMLTKGETVPDSYIAYESPYNVLAIALGDTPVGQVKSISEGGILYGKKWVVCGDSFSNYTNKDIDGGEFDGQDATYPRLIAERCNMELVQTFFRDGRTLAFPAVPGSFTNSLTCPTADCYYQNIPDDADYITFYIGINDEHHYTGGGDGEDPTGVITLGTIDDNTTATYYGAWNVVLSWLIANRPNAHIGIIVTNGLSIADWRQAQIDIAKKYGIAYIDMNGNERTPAMLRTINPDIASAVKSALTAKWAVDPTGSGGSVNTHPNWQAHEYESTFIENFLKTI